MKAKIRMGEKEYDGFVDYREHYHPAWSFMSDCAKVNINGGIHLTKTMALADARAHGIIIED